MAMNWKRAVSGFIVTSMMVLSLPFGVKADSTFVTKKFDFGALGVEKGYTGVSATDAYSKSKGYGFADTNRVANVAASGSGAGKDAISFLKGTEVYPFCVDVPNGVYKITVTTGDVASTSIFAEEYAQLLFLTGKEAKDSFEIPVTDGQLNLYAGAGLAGTEFSISSLEIEQVSTGTETKPTIWICGDTTVASYYNIPDDAIHGWGQYLGEYVDSSYNVRNLSVDGVEAGELLGCGFFDTVEHYGKSGDIFLLSFGITDYVHAYKKNSSSPDATAYKKGLAEMARRAKAKGMTVYMVTQQSELDDCTVYPVRWKKWFNDEMKAVASAEKVGVIDLHREWLENCMIQTYEMVEDFYLDGPYMNLSGTRKLAETVYRLLFNKPIYVHPSSTSYDPVIDAGSYVYETEVSGGIVKNPHKGFVMTTYHPGVFESSYEYGIGGSADNHAWDVVTIGNGEHFWKDLNPKEDVYNWQEIDDMLDACEKHGMTYVIRIMPYSHLKGSHDNYGAEHDYVPQWVYDKGAKKQRVKYKEKENTWFDVPVWDDYHYLEACKKFATALAEHFDGDPRVEFIDIRPFGDWGEWHFSSVEGSEMPSVKIQNEMLQYYKDAFKKTLVAVPSDVAGESYKYALSIGVAKRDDGIIASANREWSLLQSYRANMPVLGENAGTYDMMLHNSNGPRGPLRWTPERFKECMEISHMSIYALDQDNQCSYVYYKEQKAIIDEMCNRLGYNFTVTSAVRNGNKLEVTIKNTGLAPAFFNIDLCAEITDAAGNKIGNFGSPVRISSGTFHDDTSKTFVFEYTGSGEFDANSTICLALYDCDNPLCAGKDPTIKFDNKNTLVNNRLELVVSKAPESGAGAGAGAGESTVTSSPKPTSEVKPTNGVNPTTTAKPTSVVTPTGATKPTVTANPTKIPTAAPTTKPTVVPTAVPSVKPTSVPTTKPTETPVVTVTPDAKPTAAPADKPTVAPDTKPTTKPTAEPTKAPATTTAPDGKPTIVPSNKPTKPNGESSVEPTIEPTVEPTKAPSVEDFAERLYTTCLGREAEEAGKDYWTSELKGGKTGAEVAEGFFFSPEYEGRKLNNEEFIGTLYETFMGRTPADDEVAYWSSEMENGKDRKFIFDGFVNSPEWANICLTYGIRSGGLASPTFEKEASDKVKAFAERLYTTCLGREAEKEGLEWWAAELANLRQTGTVAASGFFYSPEFLGLNTSDDEYVTRLYRTFMGREPEEAGFEFWTSELKSGKDRQYVFDGFSAAPEFADLCADAGIMR